MRILKLIYKNTLRHKLRSSLTILGIAIAVIAFGLLRTVVTAWSAGVEASAADRLVTRHSVSFIFPLPYSYKEKIEHIQGVSEVSFQNWFGGVYKDKNQFFARMASADNIFDVYPEYALPKDQLDVYKKERNACIVGKDIADKYNFKLGDIITMDGDIYPGQWAFVVRGIYQPKLKTTDGTQMFFHWEYLNERMTKEMPGRANDVGWYIIKIKDPSQSATISEKVDALFKNSPAETKTETERAFNQGFLASTSAIITAMNVMSFMIIGIIMLVLGNTMIMASRERTREYAVFKTLGFSGKHMIGLILGESMFIACLGSFLGLILVYPIVGSFEKFVPKIFFPVFYIEPITLILAITAALFIGIAASIFPIQRVLTTKIVEGFRFVG
jgi:putative ABC transport system permease protein